MAPTSIVQPQALGSEPEGDVRDCMFCGQPLSDRGKGFMDHIAKKDDCRQAYEAWLERLDEDRPGG